MLPALITVAVILVLTVVLPVLSFARAAAALDRVERLERRLAVLEDQARHSRSTRPTAAPEPGTPGRAAETAPAPPGAPPAPVEGTRTTPPSDVARPAQPGWTDTSSARLEAHIGKRWILYVGVSMVVIGMGLFVRYAFANQWITEPLRVGIGAGVGALLILSGRRFSTAGHRPFGQTLVGGGFATWYLAVYAALNLYGLVNPVVGFTLLVLVTVAAAGQADRLRSQPLAMMAVVGGFGTPFLVGTDANDQLLLFGYSALLIGATVYLAHRRDWPALNLASFLLTGLTVLAWGVRFYRPGAYLSTELFFTLYGALFLWVLYRMRRSTHPVARWVRLALWTTPAWYHAASLEILRDHWLALLVYLIAVTGVGLAVSVRWAAMWTRVLLWAVVAAPLLAWTDGQPDGSWLAPALVTWLTVASMHAFAQLELLTRVRGRLHAADVLLIPANGLGLFFGLRAVLEPHTSVAVWLVAATVAVAHGALLGFARRVDPRAALHFLVVAVTLAMVALAVRLDGAWVTMLWATEAAGLIWLGLREDRAWIRVGGALLLGSSVLGLLALQLAPVPAAYTVFLNQRATLGLFIVGIFFLVARLHERIDPDTASHRRRAIAVAVVGANALMLVTLSAEISGFWEIRGDTVGSAELVRQMMLSATWSFYAAGLTAVGIKRRSAPVRYLALVVFAITVVKVLTVDFAQLDSGYRIVSSLALGLLLIAASYLYQRYAERLGDGGYVQHPSAVSGVPMQSTPEHTAAPSTPTDT